MDKTKLLVVVGPTAAGKTRLAVELAKAYNGEIISADSMQVYKQMNIATAKPTPAEMEGVPHHLVDFLPLDKAFSVSDFVTLAREKIGDIAVRGKLPIVVGGTGLYINSLVNNVSFTDEKPDPVMRERLYEQAGSDNGESLYNYLLEIDPESAKEIHKNNYVRLVRAVEVYKQTGKTLTEQKRLSTLTPSPYDTCVIGLNYRDRQKLYDNINGRVSRMVEQGLIEEAKKVLAVDNLKTCYNAIGYKELMPYFENRESLEECLCKIRQESRRYAKRQLTWFRRNGSIYWFYIDDYSNFYDVIKKIKKYVETFIYL